MILLVNLMEYLDGYLENIMSTLPTLFVFLGGYYVNRTQYQKNNIILILNKLNYLIIINFLIIY